MYLVEETSPWIVEVVSEEMDLGLNLGNRPADLYLEL